MGGVALREAVVRNADEFAEGLAPVVADLQSGGVTTLAASPRHSTRAGCSPGVVGGGR